MTKSPRLIALVGGGSGGHVYPVLAVARALYEADSTLRFVYIGQRGGREVELVARTKVPFPLPFVGVTAEKLRRHWHWKTFVLPFAILAGAIEAVGQLASLKPAVVFCKGGYVSVPVAVAAWFLRIPIVLHETDAVMGLANRLVSPFASRVALGLPRPNLEGTSRQTVVYTGQPIAPEFSRSSKRRTPDLPTLLVTGGSQGAHAVNVLVASIAPELVKRYRVIHLTGEQDFASVKNALTHRNYEVIAYTHDMASVLAQADLVVSRAGGTIFELAALGKPAILVPLPSAGSDHQRANARLLAERDAAVYLDEVGLTGEKLLETITQLMRDSDRRATLSTNVKEFARPGAAAHVAQLILEVARK